ncbi:hypothetical protein BY458DRAFT_513698 [Sporodiniella umbellata]|nr:hypothetical protein BY458DRAFT_513698 [Sporodiniella umbellata]
MTANMSQSKNNNTQGSKDTPPRAALNVKVKGSSNENTKMTEASFKTIQNTEEEFEDEAYSFQQSMESSTLNKKRVEPEAPYLTYRHASYDGLVEQKAGRYHSLTLDDADNLSAQEALYKASVFVRPQRTRRSSSQADSILHALTPPSHSLKARRFSKNNVTSVGMSRKRSLVSEYQKELSSHSAVSPRFMTLRKLSEVTTLPSYGYPYAQQPEAMIPPVPQIPSHLTPSSSPPLAPMAPPSPPSHSPVHGPKVDELDAIDYMHQIWTQHQQAWEEQRNEAFGLAEALVSRIEQDVQQRLGLLSHKECGQLKARVAQLEKQHEIDVAIIKSQQMDKEKVESRLKQEEVKWAEMKSQHQGMKAHVACLEQTNRQLTHLLSEMEKATTVTCSEKSRAKSERSLPPPLTQEGPVTWADMMESEDEAKKNAEMWATKYRELEKAHQGFCHKLKQEKANHQKWKAEKEQEIRQLKQIDSINRVQLDYLQTELKKTKPSHRHASNNNSHLHKYQRVTKRAQNYVAKDGYLTFTAEMNGQLSKYSVRIPQDQARYTSYLNPNAPAWTKA